MVVQVVEPCDRVDCTGTYFALKLLVVEVLGMHESVFPISGDSETAKVLRNAMRVLLSQEPPQFKTTSTVG